MSEQASEDGEDNTSEEEDTDEEVESVEPKKLAATTEASRS